MAQAVPWIVAGALTAGSTAYGAYQQNKMKKDAKASQNKMAQALNKPKPAAPQAGQNKGAIGKVGRTVGGSLMTGAGGSGGTGAGKGLLY